MGDCTLHVGLGNPGGSYAGSRHNVGFMVVDAVAHRGSLSGVGGSGSVAFRKTSSLVEMASVSVGRYKIILAKPLTYMNLSGRAVRFLVDFYKLKSEDLCVFHDDIDLEFGRIKIKRGGGNGGHNGLRSIDDLVGRDYWRVRIGIGRPEGRGDVTSYVLHEFREDEMIGIQQIAQKISENIAMLLEDPKKLEQRLNEQ